MSEKLTVHKIALADAWKDVARIPRKYRKDVSGRSIRRAEICDVTIGDKHRLLAIHGCPIKDARILLDSPTRIYFDVEIGSSYEVKLCPVGWFGYWRWAWKASEPAYRVPAQISLVSLFLGVVGLLLGALSLWPVVKPWLEGK